MNQLLGERVIDFPPKAANRHIHDIGMLALCWRQLGLFASSWQEIDFCKTISEKFSIDPLTCTEDEAIQAVNDAQIAVGEKLNKARAIDHLWKSLRKGISGPAFLINVPVYLEAEGKPL